VRRAGELVTGFQRTPIALRVGSPIAPVPGLVSMVLVCKRADEESDETGRPVGLASRSSVAHVQAVCIAADIRDVRPRDVGEQQVRITQASTRAADVDPGGMPSCSVLGGGLVGTTAHLVSYGDGLGDRGVARLGLAGVRLSPACPPDHRLETAASR
jgi:hypothetical protein